MNYTTFEQMETSPLVRQKDESAQQYMERIFRVACGPAEGGQDRPVRVNDMLEPEFVSCSAEEQTLELRFPLNEWMLNPMGTMPVTAVRDEGALRMWVCRLPVHIGPRKVANLP